MPISPSSFYRRHNRPVRVNIIRNRDEEDKAYAQMLENICKWCKISNSFGAKIWTITFAFIVGMSH
jgi:hypothetical protein